MNTLNLLKTRKINQAPESGSTGNLPDILEQGEAIVCPRCSSLIPPGKLYCENCGEEIHFVPEFEPEVDDSIKQALSGVADEIASEHPDSGKGFVRREDSPGSGYLDFHIRISKRFLRYAGIGLCAALVITLAVISIPRIMRLQIFQGGSHASEEPYVANADPAGSDPAAGTERKEDTGADPAQGGLPSAPVLVPAAGSYEGEILVSVTDPGKGIRYYYTLDGREPTENSERYLGPVPVSGEGAITFRIVAFSSEGARGGETQAVYDMAPAGPAEPVILEDSGEYTQSTMIVVVSQENGRITYTTDGSDPEQDSTEYTAPIKMPVGSSVFRFRAFDENGNASEIVERNYHLVYARLVTEEQAVSSVLRVLVDKNVLIDETGKVLGQEGYNTYIVESTIEIEGAGEYYRIVERYNHADGTYEDTGLLYAVNTNDGSVHRLGYDSSGNYTLFTLSGR